MPTALIILAAGQGTRMNSDLPKVLHEIGGAPLLVHAMSAGAAIAPDRTVVVTGHGAEAVAHAAKMHDPDVVIVHQDQQNGTGHAVNQAREALADFEGDVIVLFGDTPFIRPETIERMIAKRRDHAVVMLGFVPENAGRYGRLVMTGDSLERIVEFKDATDSERAITLCNSGVVAADGKILFELLAQIGNDNASGEFYLTDIVEIARAKGLSASSIICDESETLGINTRSELAAAECLVQVRKRAEAQENGVTMIAPETVFFSYDTVIGRDSVIEPNVVFGPGVTVESGARIRAFSHLEGCHVARANIIGPYARLRPGTELAEHVKIGNFVEIKNAAIAEGAKVNHLSYIGDATIGSDSNIGAGTITCNYDGVMKHKTQIGNNVFIGSNTMLVAPVKIGDEAMTASGSVITRDVEAQALAIARARQQVKPGLAKRLMEKLKAFKYQRNKG